MSASVTLIDAHTHTQPNREATEAFMAELTMPAAGVGTDAELLLRMDEADIEWTMIVPFIQAQNRVAAAVAAGTDRDEATANVLTEWHELNSWAAECARRNPRRIKTIVGVDPVLMSREQVEAEVSTQLAAGASGLKIAPMFLGVPADDPRVEIVWQLAVQHDVPVLSESGASAYEGQSAWGHPKYFEEVIRSYPTLRLQLAHLGMGAEDVMARVVRLSDTVITDTALRMGGMAGAPVDPGNLRQLIDLIGPEYVAFGSNYPIVDQRAYAAALRGLGLSEPDLRRVGHDNAARLWGSAG